MRLMFKDEAGFTRINKPKRCWCVEGVKPVVSCHHIREYWYFFGAVEPIERKYFFLVMPSCDTTCKNVFLRELLETYQNDSILLVCDGAAWHISKILVIPSNIKFIGGSR